MTKRVCQAENEIPTTDATITKTNVQIEKMFIIAGHLSHIHSIFSERVSITSKA